MLSHEKAADVQQTRREAGTVIEDLEAENAKLRADLAHRTSQLHSAVTPISAMKRDSTVGSLGIVAQFNRRSLFWRWTSKYPATITKPMTTARQTAIAWLLPRLPADANGASERM